MEIFNLNQQFYKIDYSHPLRIPGSWLLMDDDKALCEVFGADIKS